THSWIERLRSDSSINQIRRWQISGSYRSYGEGHWDEAGIRSRRNKFWQCLPKVTRLPTRTKALRAQCARKKSGTSPGMLQARSELNSISRFVHQILARKNGASTANKKIVSDDAVEGANSIGAGNF